MSAHPGTRDSVGLAGPWATRRIRIDSLRVQASVGILEHELRSRQELLISIDLQLPHAPVLPAADGVQHVLDYRSLRDIAKQEAEGAHVNMLETLAGRIALRLVALRGVGRASVRVTKPDIFPDCDGVSVEVTATPADLHTDLQPGAA